MEQSIDTSIAGESETHTEQERVYGDAELAILSAYL
jgi:hypothetical protein